MVKFIEEGKVKKQVIVDVTLYRRMKAKMFLDGKTFSKWLEEKMSEELDGAPLK